ncbi:cytochrome c oxidase assembly protein [Sinobaca sp. H24]|uniref:cytochrome c oxidase assembly protein n=1 Tax=Sinobaca sp. H24 TaxID=2923376 RepID=UPI0027E39CB8|nr:cytochrome c oxidase assembly protein [Sinobaca sp. H24]
MVFECHEKKQSTNRRIEKSAIYLWCLLLFLVQSFPLLGVGNTTFTVHMLQQTATYFLVPILILLGLTDSLLKPLYNHRVGSRLITVFTKPGVALILFNIIFSIYYVPFVFEVIIRHPLYQAGAFLLLFPLAFMMWWPVVSPAKNGTTLQPLLRIVYIAGIGVLLTPIGIYIIFSGELLSSTYLLRDQQVGGVAWKMITVAIYIMMIGHSLSEAVKEDKL